jgi:hypothetical protein
VDVVAALDRAVSLEGMLGYLNFSVGKPDARFQKQVSDAYATLAGQGVAEPWRVLRQALAAKLGELRGKGSAAFQNSEQVETVLSLTFDKVLPAYRQHHVELLSHLSDTELLQPFFLARVFESVLVQGSPWDEGERIVTGALKQLNDFVGHRPIAILETRPRGEPYEHERVRPIPLYLRGAGIAWGRYHDLITLGLEILSATDPGILADACYDPNVLDELALDPRAYDHSHPVRRRPNYDFGEWDPHHIDNQGRYRRYVARQITLEALLDRVANPGDLPSAEVLFEAAAVFAGTLLMATGVSGAGPGTHDSSATLHTLLPRIARYRDAFYAALLRKATGAHGERLRREAEVTRQPFGGARQHLNQYLARHRALQVQQRQLALLLGEMGYPDASRRQAQQIPAASVRLLSEIQIRLTTGHLQTDRGELSQAAQRLPEVEDLLRRGIDCGALADPWNILGFQGQFPLSSAVEDSVRDQRLDELLHVMAQTFNLYARLMSESAAAGETALTTTLAGGLRRLTSWWDRFATVDVSGVQRVHGGEALASAEHVALALARRREQGEAAADLAFWRQHLEGFRSPKAFALVVDALLRKEDYRAAMALLMSWMGQVEQVPLEEGEYSFHALALRWLLGVTRSPGPLVRKFFDYLEANAEEYWNVPRLDLLGTQEENAEAAEDEEDLYGAAYEGVTYEDSTGDDVEAEVLEIGPRQEFDLEFEGERIGKRLRFLATLARLWNLASRHVSGSPEETETLKLWLERARSNEKNLLTLLDAIHEHVVPEPLGSYDSLVEYQRRRVFKEGLLGAAIATCLETALAVGALRGVLEQPSGEQTPEGQRPAWDPEALRLEQALWQGDAETVRRVLPEFLARFKDEPLLHTRLADGGHPRQILRVQLAQSILRPLAAYLPRLGLLRETGLLLWTAHQMEQTQPRQGPMVSEYGQLFQAGFRAVLEAVIDSASTWNSDNQENETLVNVLESLSEPFLALWVEYNQQPQGQPLRLSSLDAIADEDEWNALRAFIQRYGHDLFPARFMTLANLQGIVHRGVDVYLDYLRDHPDPLHPVKLIEELETAISRQDAQRHLRLILEVLIENYEEFKDYNTTTTQSDYGENLHLLLDFLRVKADYDRSAWHVWPLNLVHEVLARKGRTEAAALWQASFTEFTAETAEEHREELVQLQRSHGMQMRSVADHVDERFIKPLAVDRLCALVEPAMKAAGQPTASPAFARFEQELRSYAVTPTGVGLDVPPWLRRLGAEVQRVHAARTALAGIVEESLRLPQTILTLEEVRRQLQEWPWKVSE